MVTLPTQAPQAGSGRLIEAMTMQPEVEWCFEFFLMSALPESDLAGLADDLQMSAVQWAEDRELGIGGGFRVRTYPNRTVARYLFGLCAGQEGQQIEPKTAEELMTHLRSFATDHGLTAC